MASANSFVMVSLPSNARIVGCTTADDIAQWVGDTARAIPLHDPKLYGEMPIMDQGSPHPKGFNLMVQPWAAAKTEQKLLYVRPITIEILGDLEKEIFFGSDAKQIYLLYTDAVQKWNASQAGIVAPTMQDMARVRKLEVLRPK